MNTVHLLHLVELFLEEEMFQTNVAEKIKTYILCSAFLAENRSILKQCGKI